MIRSIGFRCTPNKVFYSIVEKNENSFQIINIDRLILPNCLIIPEQLKYIRNNIHDILSEYQVLTGGIRITESYAPRFKTTFINRIYLEGLILELFASSTLKHYYIGQISNISKYIGIERTDFKKYIDGEKDFDQVEGWNSLKKEEKESVLTAIGGLEIVSSI